MQEVAGIHHVTAVAGDPERNIDFYSNLLGLRLVKVTVDMDAPENYHLYYGDGLGQPGTLLTFSCRPASSRGRKGTGQASVVALRIPPGSVRYWGSRLAAHGIHYEGPITRWDDVVLTFFDRDDLQVELVARDGAAELNGPGSGPVPPEEGIRGLCGVTLIEQELGPTGELLERIPGFRYTGSAPNNRFRYELGEDQGRAFVDVLALPGMAGGQPGLGSIGHVAVRGGREDPVAWRDALEALGATTTPAVKGKYFCSVYFREPGGVLFEIATDLPGLTADESAAALGTALQLPEALEDRRAEIESILPQLSLPARGARAFVES